MNKSKLVVLFLSGIFFLSACSSKNSSDKETTISTQKGNTEITANITQNSESSSGFSDYSFKGGKLETPEMDILIDKTEVGHATGEDGIIIWFTITNKSEINIIPQSELYIFDIKQQDETSEYQIATDYNYVDAAEMLYPMYNDDGTTVDDELYDKNLKLQNEFEEKYGKKFYAELMPGKEVQTAIGLKLENTEHPVTISLSEPYASNVDSEEYVINLK